MKKLHWRLLIPLLLLSGISLFIAKLLSPSLDYSSIFLNLTTDFMMVILTIYYVDQVLKANENEKWRRADYSIITRIAVKLLALIEQICASFDLHSLEQEMYPKLYNPRGTPQTAVYLYFMKEMSKKPFADVEKKFMELPEAARNQINQHAKNCSSILSEILTLHGNRLPPELLLEIVDTQELLQSFFRQPSKDGYAIFLLLKNLAKVVETTKFERLEYYMRVDKEPRDQLN